MGHVVLGKVINECAYHGKKAIEDITAVITARLIDL